MAKKAKIPTYNPMAYDLHMNGLYRPKSIDNKKKPIIRKKKHKAKGNE